MRKICFMGKEYAGYTTADMSNPALDIETYGTSSTASGTVTKVVSTNNRDFKRLSGAYVVVTFTNANTGTVSLNVDGTGSRPAYYNGARINAINGNFQSGDTVVFMYDGTYYQRLDTDTDDTSILKGLAKLGWTDALLKGKLLLKKVLAKILNCDYVIEEGTTDIWTYRKWASGIAECWGRWSGDVASYYGPDSGGRIGFQQAINYPAGLFISVDHRTFNPQAGTAFTWAAANILGSPTSATYYFLAINLSAGYHTCYIDIYAKGRWKNFNPVGK